MKWLQKLFGKDDAAAAEPMAVDQGEAVMAAAEADAAAAMQAAADPAGATEATPAELETEEFKQ